MVNDQPSGEPSGPPALTGSQPDPEAFSKLLAARQDACAALSDQQVRLAEVVRQKVKELDVLKEALATAEASIKTRYEETARLSSMVLELHDSLSAKNNELLESETRRTESERLQAEDRAQLAEARLVMERTEKEQSRAIALLEQQVAMGQARCQALESIVSIHRGNEEGYRSALQRIESTRTWKLTRLLHTPKGVVGFTPKSPPHDQQDHDSALLRNSDLFDASWYLATYPDVADSGLDPLQHFLRIGVLKGFDPSPGFDLTAYLLRYPDVRRSGMNPVAHYLLHGRTEGRIAGAGAESVGG